MRGRAAPIIAWVATAPWILWALIRVFGLESGSIGAQALAFTPFVAVAAVIPILIAALLRVWPATAVAVLVAAVLVLAVAPREFGHGSEPDGEPGPTLRVLAANMMLGGGDPQRLVDLVEQLDVDVLSVEELTPELERGLEDAGLTELLPQSVLEPLDGSGGGGLYGRVPGSSPDTSELPGGFAWVSVRLELPSAPAVDIASVHTVPPTAESWEQDLENIPPTGGTTMRILIGDFNATLDHDAFRNVLDRGYDDAAETIGAGLTPTWPVGHREPPLVAIDHVLADERLGVSSFSVHEIDGTDHKAVFAELVLPAG